MEAGKRFCLFNVLVFIIFYLNDCYGDTITRQVETNILQPKKSPENSTLSNLFYTKAEGPNDTLHYISGTYGLPSIFVAKTDVNTELNINWDEFLSNNISAVANSIRFNGTVHYVYGIQFLKLIEYDDEEDKADLSKANPNLTHEYDLSFGVPWANSSLISDLDKNEIIFKIEENYTDGLTGSKMEFHPGGSLLIKMHVNDELTRATNLPCLQLTPNTTEIDVIMDHLIPHYDKTRYGLELFYITTDQGGAIGSVHLDKITSIDDEHTPGVFQIVDISVNMTPASFIQWKPVCYKSPNRAMKTATKVKNYPLDSENNSSCSISNKKNILYAYFGEAMCSSGQYGMAVFNVSFGLSLDKFYTHTNYTAWSFILGYGEVSPEKISLLVIIIISVGLGVPVLIILFGSFGALAHKKKREDKSGASHIN